MQQATMPHNSSFPGFLHRHRSTRWASYHEASPLPLEDGRKCSRIESRPTASELEGEVASKILHHHFGCVTSKSPAPRAWGALRGSQHPHAAYRWFLPDYRNTHLYAPSPKQLVRCRREPRFEPDDPGARKTSGARVATLRPVALALPPGDL
jgi:hypothetical protein